MAGPILRHHGESRREQSISWASRSSADSPQRRGSLTAGLGASPKPALPRYFSPSETNRYEDSPLPIESPDVQTRPPLEQQSRTAPAVMHSQHRPLSKLSAGIPRHGELSYHEEVIPAALIIANPRPRDDDDFELDPEAPIRAAKQRSADAVLDSGSIKSWSTSSDRPLPSVKEEEEHSRSPPEASTSAIAPVAAMSPSSGPSPPSPALLSTTGTEDTKEDGPVWGQPFQIEWIRTERLPFYRTRHLRNPWNHDREVKVSRDGTELEPTVGQALLDEWDKPEPPPPPRPGTKSVPPETAVPKQT
jgi:hypothetical protein